MFQLLEDRNPLFDRAVTLAKLVKLLLGKRFFSKTFV